MCYVCVCLCEVICCHCRMAEMEFEAVNIADLILRCHEVQCVLLIDCTIVNIVKLLLNAGSQINAGGVLMSVF